MRPNSLIFLVLAACLVGCGKGGDKDHSVVDKTIHVKEDDAKMNAAIAKARATVNEFIAAHKAPKPGQSGFSIKMDFVDAGKHEHMWLEKVTYDGKKFHGLVNNEPSMVKNVKMGQQASVEPGKVSDWMYIDRGTLRGGYTIRVLRDGLSPQERATFDKEMPFKID